MLTDARIARVAQALESTLGRAYTTPLVYPWAVQNFQPQPLAPRPVLPPGPRRLYVHIPFCNYHCTFCFYAVRTGARREEMVRYVAALRRELQWVSPGTTLSRLVVGGGTPTALPPALLSELIAAIFERAPGAADGAHTLEASPDSLTDEHLEVLCRHGIGRVSVGVESTDDAVLTSVHRRHTPDQALEACRSVKRRGLSLNVDLIYGLPSQTEDSFRRDLDAVASTGVDSLCLYGLRLNQRTVVAAQLAPEERLDLARVMRWRAFVKRAAEESGFVQTRCYTFKRAGASRSWHERTHAGTPAGEQVELGLGMSARSQLGGVVYRNHERNDVYMSRIEQGDSPVESTFELHADDLKTQLIAGTLANGRALDRQAYLSQFGSSFDADFEPVLARLRAADLVEDNGHAVTLTDIGRLVYDRILMCFYPERARRWLASAPSATPGLQRFAGIQT